MPIRTVFVATVAVLLFVTSGIIIASSYVTAERVLLGMAQTVLQGYSKDVQSKVENFLSPAEKVVRLTRGVVAHTILKQKDQGPAERYFIEQLRLNPQLAGLYYGNTEGEFFYIKRDDEVSPQGFRTKIISKQISPSLKAGNGKSLLVWRDSELKELERRIEADSFDPRVRPWFRKAEKGLIWTSPYIFFSSGKPGVSTAYPLILPDGTKKGVVGVDIELDQLSSFLGELDLGDSGSAFILGQSGEVIAFSNPKLMAQKGDGSKTMPRFKNIEELADPVSKEAYHSFVKKVRSVGEDGITFTSFRVGGETHHGAFIQFPNPAWPWTIGIYLPEGDFLGGVKQALYANIMIALFITLVAIFAGLLIARSITRPIMELRDKATAMAKGEFDVNLEGESAFKETADMIDSFRGMIKGLREYENKNKELTDGLKESRSGLEVMVAERTRELLLAKEMAEDATQAKSRVLAAASHDLRQPLQALTLFVETLAMTSKDEKQHRLVGKINATVEALDGMLELLLDISKLDAGLIHSKMTTVDLGSILERLADEFQPLGEVSGLQLKFVLPRDCQVFSDRVLVERILRNLLTNAMRYTNEGRILIGCRRDGKKVRVEVWDTGVGIAEDQLTKIFRDFYQVGNLARDRRKGFGLGLSIVSRLSMLIDADLDVKSTLGKGSVFSISLPLAEDEAENLPVLDAVPHVTKMIRREGGTVLVIDDEPDILAGMSELIELWGHNVIAVMSSGDALDAISDPAQVPDLIIADYRLGGGDRGDWTIERIRKAFGAKIPGVLVTGDTTPEMLAEADEVELTVLHKPVPTHQLRQLIEDVVGTKLNA